MATASLAIGRIGLLTHETRQAVLHCYNYECQYCSGKSGQPARVVDHIIPVSPRHADMDKIDPAKLGFPGGALDCLENVTAACYPCNSSKTNALYPTEITAPLLTKAAKNKAEILTLVKKISGREYIEFLDPAHRTAHLDVLFYNAQIPTNHPSKIEAYVRNETLYRRAKILIENGADISQATSAKALFWTAAYNEPGLAETLTLSGKFKKSHKDALWVAVYSGSADVVALLIGEHPQEVEKLIGVLAKDAKIQNKSKNPYYKNSDMDVLLVLLAHTNNLDISGLHEGNFYPYAAHLRRNDIIKALVKNELSGKNPVLVNLVTAAATGDLESLGQHCQNPDIDNQQKTLALRYALKTKNPDSVCRLTAAGADPTVDNNLPLRFLIDEGRNIEHVVKRYPVASASDPYALRKAMELYLRATCYLEQLNWPKVAWPKINLPKDFLRSPYEHTNVIRKNFAALLENPELVQLPNMLPKDLGHKVVKRTIKEMDLKITTRLLDLGTKIDATDETILYAAQSRDLLHIHARILNAEPL